MYIIELNQVELNNLKAFLNRVNLTGMEVPAFNEIFKAVYTAKQEENKEPDKKLIVKRKEDKELEEKPVDASKMLKNEIRGNGPVPFDAVKFKE